MDYVRKAHRFEIEYPPLPENPTIWDKFKLKTRCLIMVNETHPKTIEYFKSEVAILSEKKRHFEQFKYTIHPMSKFHQFYEVWCFFFYGFLMFFKTFDFAFIRISVKSPFENQPYLIISSIVLDILSFLNIILQFFIGYTVSKTKAIELSLIKIMLKYLISSDFYCDLFSSIPRAFAYKSNTYVYIVLLTLTLLKLKRIGTFVRLIKPTAAFFGIKSSTNTFLLGFFCIVTLIMHIMTCFYVGVPRYRTAIRQFTSINSYANDYFLNLPVSLQYIITFFKCAQNIFLIDIPHIRQASVTEEIIFNLINYVLGKVLIAAIWIILLYTFMTKRVLRVKFEEVMTELKEYMMAKQLPDDVKSRLIAYYTYKYQKVFFNEEFIRTVLSENLKKDIDVFLCKSLIKQVSIFSVIPPKTVKQIISYLIPQIYLPNDLVIQSATSGDCMYFIESGTVAVYTPSGREICHLRDGAYFGEIALLIKDQKRTTSIVAIETSKIFKLQKTHFDKCFKKTDLIYNILLEAAKQRLEETSTLDKSHKKNLFEQVYKKE